MALQGNIHVSRLPNLHIQPHARLCSIHTNKAQLTHVVCAEKDTQLEAVHYELAECQRKFQRTSSTCSDMSQALRTQESHLETYVGSCEVLCSQCVAMNDVCFCVHGFRKHSTFVFFRDSVRCMHASFLPNTWNTQFFHIVDADTRTYHTDVRARSHQGTMHARSSCFMLSIT